MSLLFLFFNLPRPLQKSWGTSLILGLLSPPRIFVSPSQIVPSWIIPSQIVPPWIVMGELLYPLVDEQVPHTPPMLHFRQSPLPQYPPDHQCHM